MLRALADVVGREWTALRGGPLRVQEQTAQLRAEPQGLEEELEEGAAAWQAEQRRKASAAAAPEGLAPEQLQKYAIAADDDALAAQVQGGAPSGVVKVRCLLHAPSRVHSMKLLVNILR